MSLTIRKGSTNAIFDSHGMISNQFLFTIIHLIWNGIISKINSIWYSNQREEKSNKKQKSISLCVQNNNSNTTKTSAKLIEYFVAVPFALQINDTPTNFTTSQRLTFTTSVPAHNLYLTSCKNVSIYYDCNR